MAPYTDGPSIFTKSQKMGCGGGRSRLMLEILASVESSLLHSLFAALLVYLVSVEAGILVSSVSFCFFWLKEHSALHAPSTFINPEKWATDEAGLE